MAGCRHRLDVHVEKKTKMIETKSGLKREGQDKEKYFQFWKMALRGFFHFPRHGKSAGLMADGMAEWYVPKLYQIKCSLCPFRIN